jgi:hypothetical protein
VRGVTSGGASRLFGKMALPIRLKGLRCGSPVDRTAARHEGEQRCMGRWREVRARLTFEPEAQMRVGAEGRLVGLYAGI